MDAFKQILQTSLLIAFTAGFGISAAQTTEIPDRGPIPFAAYDSDENGLVSMEEFYATRGERIVQRASEGRMMRNAADAPPFSNFDTDADGNLTPDELVAGQQVQMQARGWNGQPGMGQGRGPGMGKGRGAGGGRMMPTFDDIDLDGDGMISREEFSTHQAGRGPRSQ